jgi:hypothetical protein
MKIRSELLSIVRDFVNDPTEANKEKWRVLIRPRAEIDSVYAYHYFMRCLEDRHGCMGCPLNAEEACSQLFQSITNHPDSSGSLSELHLIAVMFLAEVEGTDDTVMGSRGRT